MSEMAWDTENAWRPDWHGRWWSHKPGQALVEQNVARPLLRVRNTGTTERLQLYYAMFDPSAARTPVRVDTFDIATGRIQQDMPLLLEQVKAIQELRNKLKKVEFLATLPGQLLITLIYHRRLTEHWDESARLLGEQLDARIIGRCRGQKRVLSVEHVDEVLNVEGSEYQYRQHEQVFIQPNARVNAKMLAWVCQLATPLGGDLLELYCGNGNFSIPLSRHFQRVLATEVSQFALNAARHNAAVNGTDNLDLVRLSAREVTEALACKRQFRRLQDIRPLCQYHFSTILYAVIGDQSSGLKSRQRSCPYAFVVPGSSV